MHREVASVVLMSIVATALIFSTSAEASTIDKVRGTQAIVTFDGGEQPNAGDKFFAMEGGKKKAVLEILQFKNGKAKVKIAKGKAKEGMTLVAAGAKSESAASADPDAAGTEATSKGKKRTRSAGAATLFKDMTVGAVVGYAMDSQTVTPTGLSALAMTGTGYSVKGFADIPVMGHLGLLTRVGIEQFNVQAGIAKTAIMYGVADLLLKYAFSDSGFVPFAMAGLGLHFPISKSSENALQPSNISPTTVFFGGGGFNYVMGSSSYFQLTAEYGLFPPSNDVSTSFIAIRTGLGFRF